MKHPAGTFVFAARILIWVARDGQALPRCGAK